MELIYIWIQNYNCLENIGFDFSDEFNFNFDIKSSTLIINEGNTRIDNFYGKNISNISALIGKNGIGKTTACEFIYSYIGNYYINSITVFKKDNSLVIITSPFLKTVKNFTTKKSELKYTDKEEDLTYINTNLKIQKIFFSTSYDSGSFIQSDTGIDISNYRIFEEWLSNNKKSGRDLLKRFQVEEIIKDLDYLEVVKVSPTKNNDFENLYKHLGIYFNYQFKSSSLGSVNTLNFAKMLRMKILNSEMEVINSRNKLISNEFNDDLTKEIILFICLFVQYDVLFDFIKGIPKVENSLLEEVRKKRDRLQKLKLLLELQSFDEIVQKLLSDDFKLDFKNEIHFIKTIEKGIKKKFIYNISFGSVSEFLFPTLQLFQFLIDKEFLSEFHKSYNKTIEFQEYLSIHSKISTGEKAFITLFSRLWEKKEQIMSSKSPCILILDEPEVNLHPNWSKAFLQKLITFLNQNFSHRKFQIILTSHSPHLISDLISGNVVFLNQINGKTISQSENDINVKTFAGNISQILMNSFFIDGSFIGDFSKKRIREAIRHIEGTLKTNSPINDNTIDDFISLIGDDFIKNQLLRLKNDVGNDSAKK